MQWMTFLHECMKKNNEIKFFFDLLDTSIRGMVPISPKVADLELSRT